MATFSPDDWGKRSHMLGAMLVLNHQSVFDLPALPENGPYKNCFWAPEIHKMRGRFYLVFTADN